MTRKQAMLALFGCVGGVAQDDTTLWSNNTLKVRDTSTMVVALADATLPMPGPVKPYRGVDGVKVTYRGEELSFTAEEIWDALK